MIGFSSIQGPITLGSIGMGSIGFGGGGGLPGLFYLYKYTDQISKTDATITGDKILSQNDMVFSSAAIYVEAIEAKDTVDPDMTFSVISGDVKNKFSITGDTDNVTPTSLIRRVFSVDGVELPKLNQFSDTTISLANDAGNYDVKVTDTDMDGNVSEKTSPATLEKSYVSNPFSGIEMTRASTFFEDGIEIAGIDEVPIVDGRFIANPSAVNLWEFDGDPTTYTTGLTSVNATVPEIVSIDGKSYYKVTGITSGYVQLTGVMSTTDIYSYSLLIKGSGTYTIRRNATILSTYNNPAFIRQETTGITGVVGENIRIYVGDGYDVFFRMGYFLNEMSIIKGLPASSRVGQTSVAAVTSSKKHLGEIEYNLLNGSPDGIVLDSGSSVSGEHYVIETTTVDYFGAGLVSGDRFEETTPALLSVANSLQKINNIRTKIDTHMVFDCDWDCLEISQRLHPLALANDLIGILRVNLTDILLYSKDGISTPVETSFKWSADLEYSFMVIAGIDSDMLNVSGTGPATGLVPGDKYFQIGHSEVGSSVWKYSTPAVFRGFFPIDSGRYLHAPAGTTSITIGLESVDIEAII